ncbi:MAG: hypothetical protein EXR62_04925 [Chloroflexi bacterium]|nr:hypothetical protein [Chloroflexota bacterium]
MWKIETPFFSFHLSLFDRAALITLAAALTFVLLLAWRGDQVGVRVVQVSPAEPGSLASTKAVLRITFDQDMVTDGPAPAVSLSPPVTGTLRWEGRSLLLFPSHPLSADTVYTVTLQPGLQSQRDRILLRPYTWHFRTGRPRILFMSRDAQERDQLFLTLLGGSSPLQLTKEPYGIWDYALSPDGAQIIYTISYPDSRNDLWIMNVDGAARHELLACPDGACSGAAWFPAGGRIVFEKRALATPGGPPGLPRLWWLDLSGGATAPVFQDSQILGFGAAFSADGQWLSYVSPTNQGVYAFNLNDGRIRAVPSEMGAPGVWNAAGTALIVPAIQARGEGFAAHLLQVNPEPNQWVNLSGDNDVEDSAPAWSPDGAQIAFARKLVGSQNTFGDQIWLMQADGSGAHPISDDPGYHHGLISWSPDGRYLLFQRFALGQAAIQPEIALIDVQAQTLRQVEAAGSWPTWLP